MYIEWCAPEAICSHYIILLYLNTNKNSNNYKLLLQDNDNVIQAGY